ncbi:MG2 domain-containing protein [Chitinophaga sp.]|uniref:MG2 domain-containing protein n=1 Tax=Chitinophaga sp. TaxID=1869181 RepID=UPI0031DDD1B1
MQSVKSKKNRLKWLLPLCLMGITAALAFYPADEWQDKITQALEQYSKRFPQEKVYLQVDKDYYGAGETIWFKAYVLLQGQPSLSATNLYVELIDKSGKIVQKKLISLGGATGSGAFVVPETMPAGQYQIRAYTAWMLNFDPEFLYYKDIEIFDSAHPGQLPSKPAGNDFAVQFFPEGGNAIVGVGGRIAFKAIDQQGYPIEVNGIVQNLKGETVALLKTTRDGMGMFDLTPVAGETYKAIVQTSKGQQKTVLLPVTKTAGVGLKIFNKGTRIFYQTLPATKDNPVYNNMLIVAQMQQHVIYKAKLNSAEGQLSGFIPTAALPSGIVQFTIFNADGMPMAERLAFVRKPDQLQLTLQNLKINNQPRQKNVLEVKVPDTMLTSLSVSITDADNVVISDDQNNILSNLLMTSDLKGYIANPAQYFRDMDPATLQGLDLIMMTNGWRRFTWEKILHNYLPEIKYPYEQGLLLKGIATINKGTAPLANGKVDFILKQPVDTSTAFSSVTTNDKGEFAVDRLQFVDTINVFYRANDPNKAWKDVNVKFEPHFFETQTSANMPYPFREPQPIENTVLTSFLNTVNENNAVTRSIQQKPIFLTEYNVKDKRLTRTDVIENRYATGMFNAGDGYSFDLTRSESGAISIFQYLQSKVPGLTINTTDPTTPAMQWRGGAPVLFLNEMPTSVAMLNNINIQDVAFIKVLRPTFVGGFGGSSGAIAVYLRRGGDSKSDVDTHGFEKYRKAGYDIVKEFYAPDYTVRKEIHILQDKRLTLYWNPNLVADTLTHTARISFYNNDFTRRFRVVVEGMAEDGTLGRVEQLY